MNELFYYFGIIYLISDVWSFIETFFKDDDSKEMIDNISKSFSQKNNEEIDIGNAIKGIKKSSNELRRFALKKHFSFFLSIFIFNLAYIGNY